MQGHIVALLLHLNLEYVLVLAMGQPHLLKIGEHEEVWHDKKGQAKRIIHRLEPVVQNGQSCQRLKPIAETCTHAERGDQLLRYRLDVADDGGFTDGARRLEDQGGDRGRWNADGLGRKHDRHVQNAVGDDLEQTHVEKSQVVWRVYQVVRVEHASEDGHRLHSHQELGALQVPVVHLTQFG